jgi:hypothetical protein
MLDVNNVPIEIGHTIMFPMQSWARNVVISIQTTMKLTGHETMINCTYISRLPIPEYHLAYKVQHVPILK